MSLVTFLHALFVQPLFWIYDGVFTRIVSWTDSAGWSLVAFSVVLNLVLLPIYYQMERAHRTALQRREDMDREVARMKAHYTGRERYFYIRTVHRVFGYRPAATLFSSTDLYLQVLVFATVYQFLAEHPALVGSEFLAIGNLARPDGLLFGAHALPIVMTLLNVLSTLLYTNAGAQRRNGFVIAALFLALLYASPSGVVLYWTCNNACSLVRNLIERAIVPRLPVTVTRTLSRLASQE